MEDKITRPFHRGCSGASVDLYTHDEVVENRLLRGRALLDVDNKKFFFAQNEPRAARSVEIGRTMHSRLVRRPDSRYTLSFSAMDAGEKNLREALLSEVRTVMDIILADVAKQKRKEVKDGESK